MELIYGTREESFKYAYGSHWVVEKDEIGPASVSLETCRNSSVAFQAVILGNEKFGVSLDNSPFFYLGGDIELLRLRTDSPADGIYSSLNFISLVEDDDRLFKSDIIDEKMHAVVTEHKIQQVLVTVKVLNQAKPGIYQGKVSIFRRRLFEKEEKIGEVTYTLRISPVSLPSASDFRFYLDLLQHNSNIARKYDVPLWSDAHFEVMERYVACLAELGQKAVTVIASEIPWSGQRSMRDRDYPSDYFEYSMVRVSKDSKGNFKYDFSVMDRYVSLCEKYGIKDEIEVIGLLGVWEDELYGFGKALKDCDDAVRIRYYDEAAGVYSYLTKKSEFESYLKTLEAHFIATGRINRVRIMADEPADKNLYFKRLNFIKMVAPSFKFKAAVGSVDFLTEESDVIDDLVPLLTVISENVRAFEKVRAYKKGRLLWYVCCCPPLPNVFISSPAMEGRFIGWLTYLLGLGGFVRWNFTAWPERPLERISFRASAWKAGDTNFVYPGRSGKPLLTLRYCQLLQGIRDFELIAMCLEKGLHQTVKEAVAKIARYSEIADFHPDKRFRASELYSLEQKDYDSARSIILRALESQILSGAQNSRKIVPG